MKKQKQPTKKQLKTYTKEKILCLNKEYMELANLVRLKRAIKYDRNMESLSDLYRNLIIEGYEKMLIEIYDNKIEENENSK